MALPTVALNETTPAGGAYVRDGDDRIREYKIQNREILEVDHYYPSSGQNDACGRHKQLTLIEAADIGTGASGVPILGAQTLSGKPELTYTDEDDTDVIITKAGVLYITAAAMAAVGAAIDIGAYTFTASQLISDIAIGTAPLVVTSTTKVTNLNADLLDGYNAATAFSAAAQIYVSGADGYLPDGTVDTTALKTATGEVSGDLSTGTGGKAGVIASYGMAEAAYTTQIVTWDRDAGGNQVFTLPGGQYAFFPQSKRVGANGYWQTRYVTASGEDHWIFLLIDKITKEIISAYSAPDHPAYGNGGDFDKMPHPFNSYDETKHEIILLSKNTCTSLKLEREQMGDSILTLVNEEYKPNMSEEEAYQPLHSGRFMDEKPELVQTIPDYVKVRKLTKLTQAEKDLREQKYQQTLQEIEQTKVKKEQSRVSAKNKLIALGLNADEIGALGV